MSPVAVSHFAEADAFRAKVEGGWFDNPDDVGGPTTHGLTEAALVGIDRDKDGVADFDFDRDGDIDRSDMVELDKRLRSGDETVRAEVEQLYRERYWDPIQGDELPWPLSLVVYDSAVNNGPGAAAVVLQRACGVTPDGIIGRQTITAALMLATTADWLDRLSRERVRLYRRICDARLDKALEQQARRISPKADPRAVGLTHGDIEDAVEHAFAFMDGWMTRVSQCAAECARLSK